MNNFFPIGQTNADIYIGTGAGKRIYAEIENAQNEIKVISPYLTLEFIKLLVDKAKSGVKVTLITNDMNRSHNDATGHREIVHNLFEKNRITDNEAVEKRSMGIFITKIWLVIIVLLIFSAIALYFLSSLNITVAIILIVASLLSTPINFAYYKKVKRIRIYSYYYRPFFNFKIIKNNHEGDIHSKIYCVDNKKAFLGSLNFTKNGFEYFFESAITISNQETVSKISTAIDNVFLDEDREYYSTDELSKIYFIYEQIPY